MHISRFDGTVSFDSGSIQRSMNKAGFLASPLGKRSEPWFARDSFETYRLTPEPGIIASTNFRNMRLLNVSISIGLPDDSRGNQSVEHELVRKKKHDEWLLRELGRPPYRYDWGEVTSYFYHQHCESEIIVSYDQPESG